jgi:hypothetical protein
MATVAFDRDGMAEWYATQHLKVDDGIAEVIYLPTNADNREIRFLEINKDMLDADDTLEPINFGVDMGDGNEHVLWVIDVSADQYDRIRNGSLPLPAGWSLESRRAFTR